MKTIKTIIYLALIIGISACGLLQNKTTKESISFTVKGNCEMCKERIENSLDVKGVFEAYYDLENQTIYIKYNSSLFNDPIRLHNMIANMGHDTELVNADDVVYANLPDCCKYREEEEW